MIIIIPLGGTGERFKNSGYRKPKALINVFGKPILFYLLDNLNLKNIDFVYIPYNKEYLEYNFEDFLNKSYPHINFKFLALKKNTEGAAETLNIALKTLDCEDKPILCLDSDNFYTIDIISLWNGQNRIVTFQDFGDNPIYSYLNVENDNVLDIVEKNKISNKACCGSYGFSSYKNLLLYSQKVLDNKIKQKGEYYTSNVIREMIKDEFKFDYKEIDICNYHCLGTPIQVKHFYNNYPRVSSLNNNILIKQKRFCFDLDNTLVTYPKIQNDYTSVEPITKNIKLLKYIKSFGHTIIIYTARRMRTHHGNVGKIMCDVGKITFDTLEKFDIPFDEIYFGKPYADFYIDDLAYNCYDNLEKELGYYMDNINPRDFNQLDRKSIETFTKKSNDLSGEIYYYKNIPSEIKDLFPVLLDFCVDNKWYTMEKINGITLSNLYLNELLTGETLIHIMNSIRRIHCVDVNKLNEGDINIYDNYSKKLIQRYNSYDYSKFNNCEQIFNALLEKLTEYENGRKGKCVVIHGDPVMTNIIVNNFGKIKFIDMRGKLGDKLTICGDFLYDWAKLYQSLIGYDKILLDKPVSEIYEKKMIDIFEKKFIELYSMEYLDNLKIITKSLLFTLIPLHDNHLCYKYYDLINSF